MTTTDTSTTAATEPAIVPPNPEAVLSIAGGFMAAKHLFVASELGIFEALAEGPTALDGLAARTGLTPRAARISADAMVALGLVEKRDGVYANGPAAASFLAGSSPVDLRPLLRFWDKISYPAWLDLAHTLGHGPKKEIVELDESLQSIASAGIEAFQAGPSATLPDVVDLPDDCRLLDVGGGTGSWSLALAQRHSSLRATVFELPVVADVARARIAETGLGDRVDIVAGDATTDVLPPGFDTFLLANVVHYWSPDQNREVLRRIRDTAEIGARVLLVDFWTDATHTEPFVAAMMAGEFAVHLENGDVYSVDEARSWLDATGWRFTGHRQVTGPMSVVLGAAV
jgi:SAM-dependent methyltransferase